MEFFARVVNRPGNCHVLEKLYFSEIACDSLPLRQDQHTSSIQYGVSNTALKKKVFHLKEEGHYFIIPPDTGKEQFVIPGVSKKG